MSIPRGKLDPQVAVTLLKFSLDATDSVQEMEKYFNSLCDLYKRETMEDFIHG
jgi:ribosomal protein L18E